jgi:glycosyltransferase involved in cell wall biosynthesis
MKQRLLLISRSLQMGGVEKNTVNLANTLVEQGHEVHILCFKKRYHLQPDKRVYVHFHDFDRINRLTIIGYIYDLLTRLTLSVVLRKSGFVWRGIYYVIYFRIFLYFLEKKYGTVDKMIARGQGAFEYLWMLKDPRFYQVLVCPLHMRYSFRDKWYTKLIYEGKNSVANSTGVKESYLAKMKAYGFRANDIPVIPNPCPIKEIQSLAEEKVDLPERPYIVHVGRLTLQKNQPLLLEAYAESNIEEPLVIVGSGQEESKLRNLAAKLNITDKVIFVGQKANPYPWMKHARLFVLTSLFEGFGLVNVESLACGTPVVAVDCPGGIRDILVEDQSEFIVEPNPKAIAQKIRYALAHPPFIKAEWYQKFDAPNVAKMFLRLRGI